MDETLFFDDSGVGSDAFPVELPNIDPGPVTPSWADPPSPGSILPTGWSIGDIIKTAGSVAQEVARYRQATLPNGSRIYQRIDPRTGLPLPNSYTVPGSAMPSMPLLLLGGAVLFFVLKR
jgi:hypothetical protein